MSARSIHLAFDVKPVPGQILSSGDLCCLYESGRIRYLSFKGRQVIRLIYTAVRDQHWNTAAINISDEIIRQDTNGFRISYTAGYYYDETVVEAKIEISAEGNTLKFSFVGDALTFFRRNRVGICVLHPIKESAGQIISVTQPDGGMYSTVFPELVSPHQPAKNIMKMSWPVDAVHEAVLEFRGDIFEMEDQRNWTDDSYKTYSTPVDLPLPVDIHRGDMVKQTASLSFQSSNTYRVMERGQGMAVNIPMPAIGYSRVRDHLLTEEEIRLLKEIPFDHYRVELFPGLPGWQEELKTAVIEARSLDTKIELIVLGSGEVENFSEIIAGYNLQIDSVVFVDTEKG
ncbi:MAG: hypothetical protein ABI151_12915, partial [Chitinophagaceae bacterium]